MSRKSKSLSFIFIMAVLMKIPVNAQAGAWRGIVPLKSTRADVERLLGLPGKHGRYQFDIERAYIHYAGPGPCHPVNECLCLVSEDTVISIYVEIEVEMKFSRLKVDKKRFKKFISPQDPTIATYSNDQEGIIYTVHEEYDEVTAIEYVPTAKDCQEVLKRANPTCPMARFDLRECRTLERNNLAGPLSTFRILSIAPGMRLKVSEHRW